MLPRKEGSVIWRIPVRSIKPGVQPRIDSSLGVGHTDFDISGTFLGSPEKQHEHFVRDTERMNTTWLTLMSALVTIQPSLQSGVNMDDPEGAAMAEGITSLYVFLFKAYVERGYNKVVEFVKCLKDWALHYAMRALGTNGPPIPRGMLGGRATYLEFTWARGPLAALITPPGPEPNDKQSHCLFQLYLTGKSLAYPNPEQVLKSLMQHREDYTSLDINMDNLIALAYKFSFQWATFLTRKEPREVRLDFKFGTGSSLTSSRSKGGKNQDADTELYDYCQSCVKVPEWVTNAYDTFGMIKIHEDVLNLLEVIDGYRYLPRRNLYLTLTEVGKGVDNSDWLARDLGLAKLFDSNRLNLPVRDGYIQHPFRGFYLRPRHEVDTPLTFHCLGPQLTRDIEITSVLQRGNKARAVNISEWDETVLNQGVRCYLYSLAKGDREITSLSGQSKLSGFLKLIKDTLYRRAKANPHDGHTQDALVGLEILSLDLSRCSDLILAGLNQAFLEGHFEGSRANTNEYLSWIWLMSCSSRNIHYRDCNLEDIFGCNRKPAMGDPPTWWVDNAYTKFVSFLARWLALNYPERTFRDSADFNSFLGDNYESIEFEFASDDDLRVRCGDDEIAFAEHLCNIFTLMIFPLIGGKLSDGTCIRSREYGVYCEEHVKRGLCDHPGQVALWMDLLRIRPFTRPDGSDNSTVPASWNWGLSITRTIAWFKRSGEDYNLALKLTRLIYFNEIEEAFSFGLNAYGARCFGGLSYPSIPDECWRRATRLQKAYIQCIASLSSNDIDNVLLASIQEVASATTDSAAVGPYTEYDSERIKDYMSTLYGNNEVIDIQEEVVLRGNSIADWPYSSWLTAKSIALKGIEGGDKVVFIPLSSAISRLRSRLVNNRGRYFRSTTQRSTATKQASAAVEKINSAMEFVIEYVQEKVHPYLTERVTFDSGAIALAESNYANLTKCWFVREQVVDELCPDMVKAILVTV
jgi:hypothetical protein